MKRHTVFYILSPTEMNGNGILGEIVVNNIEMTVTFGIIP